jgi:hypothetical protein
MHRLYIDETGNADLKASRDPNHQFLSLTGIVMGLEYAARVAFPRLEQIKAQFFRSHPDEPIILHRKDMIARKRPFHALRDPTTEAQFNHTLLTYLIELDFTVITVVIDKLDHLNRYVVWRQDPYHYCLEILLERYVYLLRQLGAVGDVMAEVRGGKPDRRLEKSFARLYDNGTSYIRPSMMARNLTGRSLKMRPKSANVAGLQIADMIAAPSALYVRSVYNDESSPNRFGGKIVSILVAEKYYRRHNGVINRYGIKWLP